MSKILKVKAFETMVQYINKNDYDTANEIFSIINRTQKKEIAKNLISKYVKLESKKEERLFNKDDIIND